LTIDLQSDVIIKAFFGENRDVVFDIDPQGTTSSININGTIVSLFPYATSLLVGENIALTPLIDAVYGFDNCLGYLDGGFLSWKNSGNKIEIINNISPLDFTNIKDEVFTLDVRKKSETSLSSLESSIKIPLSVLESKIDHLDSNDNIYIHCAGGYRSMIAASILKRNGFNQIVDINKGFSGIQKCLINS
ncbi:MAG: hypothetical protein CMC12_01595, partial [Flavobacteriaceae bacterium]|nr:hypothetical protein [Flavobacteriaceae bacterium]